MRRVQQKGIYIIKVREIAQEENEELEKDHQEKI